jgi:two-component system NtrC family sensor kinase
MSLEQIDRRISQAQQTLMIYAIVTIVIISITLIFFLTITVLRPVHKLISGVGEISTGNLEHQIVVRTKDELGKLAQAFNEMARSLKDEKEKNRRWSETLQERIHEKTSELKAIHTQILQIEKMASLGKLSATVAHELNNPLEGILTYAKLIARRLRRQPELTGTQRQTLEDIDLIANETERCGNIVKNLLLFSKKQVGEFALVPLRHIIENATRLMQHHFAISNVQLQTAYSSEQISVMCDEQQIQQALVALFVNSVEAMPEGGTIRLSVTQHNPGDDITMILSDTGSGIAPEDIPHIFEPFFTTKHDGKGVGLGLSVVYGIIERHGGKISVESLPGTGTTFTILLPPMESAASHKHPATMMKESL